MSDSYKNINKQVFITAIFKLLILFGNFALTSLLVNYLGVDNFGVYIAFTSLFAWMFLFDLGIAKGMRNYVTIHMARNEYSEVRSYISTTYISITILSVVSCFLLIFYMGTLELKDFFNLKLDDIYLESILIVLLIGFFVKFTLSIVDQLNFSTHKSQLVSFNLFLTSFINVLGLILLINLNVDRGVFFAILVFSLSITIPYIFTTFLFFYDNHNLLPSINYFSVKKLRNIFSQGSKILFIQLGFLFFVGLDRLLLLKYGDSIEVGKYEIIYKVMSILIFPVAIVTSPLWSSFTNAFEKNDIKWIQGVFRKFYKLIFLIAFFSLLLIFFFNSFIYIWIGEFPHVSILQRGLVALLMIFIIWSSFHSDLLLAINNFKFVFTMVFLGCFLKFLLIAVVLQLNGGVLTIEVLTSSSILAYFLFNITSPFYINRLLKVKL
ncbi:hypothetical protein [Pseudoalteromonas sp. SG44-17]|uniref:hypothetical protein n=1 Tax=Pseudoalteromonas sp. SG44-17 TaxID=2760963 RepID=UPI00160212C1|nr:hypothetical protein [Pseudoalteromonas sp. SG44-17]MBB1411679.1 hypothetical protein [Pseudoalteromonas sp. SG44-17]